MSDIRDHIPSSIQPTVYIIDDDEAVRDSLSWLLGGTMYKVEAFDSAEAFLEGADYSNPVACVVTDVRMPGMSGPELQDALIAKGCEIPMIFITGHGNVSLAVNAMKKGAVDFLEKPFSDEALCEKINFCIESMFLRWQESLVSQNITERMEQLTARERDVLHCMLDSMTNKETAQTLGISIKTVEVHRARLMEKLQAKSIAELVQLVITYNQIEKNSANKKMIFF